MSWLGMRGVEEEEMRGWMGEGRKSESEWEGRKTTFWSRTG